MEKPKLKTSPASARQHLKRTPRPPSAPGDCFLGVEHGELAFWLSSLVGVLASPWKAPKESSKAPCLEPQKIPRLDLKASDFSAAPA